MALPRVDEPLVAASRWYSLLASDTATAADVAAWEAWKQADISHQQAWARVEALTKRIESLPASVNADTFLTLPSSSRRGALKHLTIIFGVGTTSVWLYKAQPWRQAFADYVTAAGEIREVTLPDGGLMVINTASTVNVRFTSQQRVIELVHGEVMIQTAHENGPYRPLLVSTQHGTATALGTRFSVRDFNDFSKVSVTEGSVKIKPVNGDGLVIKAGQTATFNEHVPLQVKDEDASLAWAKGLLVVISMPLSEFVQEIARYRSGVLRCDPAVGKLLVSGSFRIIDTDAVLEHLTQILPVRVESFTRYWTTIHQA